MNNPVIRLANASDALDLAPRLRPADAGEFLANGRCPTAGLLRCVALSTFSRCIADGDDRPIALFGFAPIDQETACPWLVGSPDLTTKYRRWFIHNSAQIVASGDHLWSRFFNRVDARNVVHVRWLRWVGFDVRPPEPHGPYGLMFHDFYRTRPCAM